LYKRSSQNFASNHSSSGVEVSPRKSPRRVLRDVEGLSAEGFVEALLRVAGRGVERGKERGLPEQFTQLMDAHLWPHACRDHSDFFSMLTQDSSARAVLRKHDTALRFVFNAYQSLGALGMLSRATTETDIPQDILDEDKAAQPDVQPDVGKAAPSDDNDSIGGRSWGKMRSTFFNRQRSIKVTLDVNDFVVMLDNAGLIDGVLDEAAVTRLFDGIQKFDDPVESRSRLSLLNSRSSVKGSADMLPKSESKGESEIDALDILSHKATLKARFADTDASPIKLDSVSAPLPLLFMGTSAGAPPMRSDAPSHSTSPGKRPGLETQGTFSKVLSGTSRSLADVIKVAAGKREVSFLEFTDALIGCTLYKVPDPFQPFKNRLDQFIKVHLLQNLLVFWTPRHSQTSLAQDILGSPTFHVEAGAPSTRHGEKHASGGKERDRRKTLHRSGTNMSEAHDPIEAPIISSQSAPDYVMVQPKEKSAVKTSKGAAKEQGKDTKKGGKSSGEP